MRPYQNVEEQPQVINEPMVAYGYGACNAEDYLEKIPEDTMRKLIDWAMDDFKSGHCTPHSQMDAWTKERMGWK